MHLMEDFPNRNIRTTATNGTDAVVNPTGRSLRAPVRSWFCLRGVWEWILAKTSKWEKGGFFGGVFKAE